MPEEKKLPFHTFAFNLIDNRQPRASLRMTLGESGMYELKVQKGSAANPIVNFSRTVPVEVAERLRDTLQAAGAFGWDESYGDTTAPGSRRWTMSVVFQEGVFALEAKGGSDVPPGFDQLLEELYRLDFPRPAGQRRGGEVLGSGKLTHASGLEGASGQSGASRMPGFGDAKGMGSAINAMGLGGLGSLGGMSAGDLGAYASAGAGGAGAGMDFAQLANLFQGGMADIGGAGGMDAHDMQELFAQAQSNPQAFRQRMKEEFRHMSPDEQNKLLDALAATGMATREWWERFLRG